MNSKMTVCVVDNDAETCESLKFLLDARDIPVSTFPSAADFLESWDPDRTGCVVVDVRMPGMTGCDLQQELNRRGQNVPLILMTGYGDVPLAVAAMKRGAHHFFEKPVPYLELLAVIDNALEENAVARVDAAELAEFERRYAKLSPREVEVAKLVAKGHSSLVIADELAIVPGTVDLHRGRIYKKLGVSNVAELVGMFVTKRVPPPDSNAK